MAGCRRAATAIFLVVALVMLSVPPTATSDVLLDRPRREALASNTPPLTVEFNVSSGREIDFVSGDWIDLPVFGDTEYATNGSFELLVSSASDLPIVVDVSVLVTAVSSSSPSPYFTARVEPSQLAMQPRENTSVTVMLNDSQDAPFGNYKLTVYFAVGNETLPFATTLGLLQMKGLPTEVFYWDEVLLILVVLAGGVVLSAALLVKFVQGRRGARGPPHAIIRTSLEGSAST
jgi:hypothetical protein